MSLLTYNGISLPYAFSSTYNQTPERDEVGDTDHYLTKFEIGVQCIINKAFLAYVGPRFSRLGATPANAADLMNLIRQDLMQHRKPISFTVNGIDMIPNRTAAGVVGSPAGTVDSKNGPQPQSCTIMSLGEETFILTFHVITWWQEFNKIRQGVSPTTVNQPTSDVLYNRWKETVELDEHQYTKRIREGAYKIRSDSNNPLQADAHRYAFAAVGVPRGFLRESSHYTVTPDGLTVNYRVTDKEYFKVPPFPAYKAEGEFTMQLMGAGGAMRYGEVRVRLSGGRYSDQEQLFLKAYAIAGQKLVMNGAPRDTPTGRLSTLTNGYIRVGMWENWVEISLRAMLATDKSQLTNGGKMQWVKGSDSKDSFVRDLVYTPRCDYLRPLSPGGGPPRPPLESEPKYYERGSQYWLLQAAAYFDPSFGETNLELTDSSATQVQSPPVTNNEIPRDASSDGPQQTKTGSLVGIAGSYQEPNNPT